MPASYPQFVRSAADTGVVVPSRYGVTRELRNRTFRLKADRFPERPRLNPKIGIVEGLFLVAGTFDLEAIKAVAPNADHSLFTLDGAYGPRVARQLQIVVEGMVKDPLSRQHVLYVARPGDQYTPDAPCTTSLQLLVRNGTVDVVANMRSSDVIKGLPTDVIQFGMLAQVVAHCFGMSYGFTSVFAASSHIYESDHDRMPTVDDVGVVRIMDMYEGTPVERFAAYRSWAVHAIRRFTESGRDGGVYFARGML